MRAVLLVASISFAPNFIDWCDQAAQALAELPAAEQVNFGDLSYSIKPGQAPTITQLEQVLQAKIKGSDFNKGGSGNDAANTQNAPQFSSNPLDFGKDVGIAWSYIAGFTQNLAWEILFAIYLLCLLLCKVIIILMQFVQKVVVIGFKLYTPIAVAEYAHRSLKSKARWLFSDFRRSADLAGGMESGEHGDPRHFQEPSSAAEPEFRDTHDCHCSCGTGPSLGSDWPCDGTDLCSESGHSRRSGHSRICRNCFLRRRSEFHGDLQRRTGGSASWLGNMKQSTGRDEPDARPVDYAPNRKPGEFFVEPLGASAEEQGESGAQSRVRNFRGAKGQEQAARGLSGIGAGMMGAGAAMMNRFGSVARFIGHAVVEGSGDGSGLEYRALAAFGPSGSNSRTSTQSSEPIFTPSAEISRRTLTDANRGDESKKMRCNAAGRPHPWRN